MRLELPGSPHLTYCTNIHPGESWREIDAGLRRHLPAVRRRIAAGRPMGVGLRLSAEAARSLSHPPALEKFRDFLRATDLYVFTVNAFPYGPFHGRPIKEQVYSPDWTRPERLRYTEHVAGVLAALLPEGVSGSISTVPGAFRGRGAQRDRLARCADGMLRVVARLVRLERATGKRLVLAPEPEPFCLLERTADFIAFFNNFLLAPSSRNALVRRTGVASAEAEHLIRRHLGICFDVCHAAVLFESPCYSLGKLRSEGIEVAKIQLSAAPRLVNPADGERHLLQLDDGVYLHQVMQSHSGILRGYLDLPEALAALRRKETGGEWRVHCHVPLFAERFGKISSTRGLTSEVLGLCRRQAVSAHLEVETYTWSVLPAELRGKEIEADIARELRWVLSSVTDAAGADAITRPEPPGQAPARP